MTRSLLDLTAAAELLRPRLRDCAVDACVHSVLLSLKSMCNQNGLRGAIAHRENGADVPGGCLSWLRSTPYVAGWLWRGALGGRLDGYRLRACVRYAPAPFAGGRLGVWQGEGGVGAIAELTPFSPDFREKMASVRDTQPTLAFSSRPAGTRTPKFAPRSRDRTPPPPPQQDHSRDRPRPAGAESTDPLEDRL